MDDPALEALHVAVAAIEALPGVVSATADNDGDSGEIIFTLVDYASFVLRLKEVEAAQEVALERTLEIDDFPELEVARTAAAAIAKMGKIASTAADESGGVSFTVRGGGSYKLVLDEFDDDPDPDEDLGCGPCPTL